MAVRPTDPEALQLFQLIGAPLLAVIQAEAQAAQVSADFIKRVGFKQKSPQGSGAEPLADSSNQGNPATSEGSALQDGGDLGDLRVAEFRIDRYGPDGRPQPLVARVPVLSLFPVPLMQVKHADFEFDMRVLTRIPLEDPQPQQRLQSEESQPKPPPTSATPATRQRSNPTTDYLDKNRVELKGFLATARNTPSGQATTDASIKVKVRMEQSDLPAGLIQLMSIMRENISLTPPPPTGPSATISKSGESTNSSPPQPSTKT